MSSKLPHIQPTMRKPNPNMRQRPTVRKGPAKSSVRVKRRLDAAYNLCGSISSFKDEVADAFRERFEVELRAGEAMPDHAAPLEIVSRSVRSAAEKLDEAEESYRVRCYYRRKARKECERIARKELNPEMVSVRREVEAFYGKERAADIHGLEGKTLRKPKRVQAQAQEMLCILGLEPLTWPDVDGDLLRARCRAWLRRVKPAYDRLVAKLVETEKLERGEEHLCGVRDRALADFDGVYGDALAYVAGVYRLVDFVDRKIWNLRSLADRRRLIREARKERQARAEGRRRGAATQPVRSLFSAATRWLRSFGSRAA